MSRDLPRTKSPGAVVRLPTLLFRSILCLCAALRLTIACAASAPSTLEQLKSAEQTATSAGAPGSPEYQTRKSQIVRSIISSPNSFRIEASKGIPSVSNDLRYNSNLLWMANDSLSNHLREFGGSPVAATEFLDVVAIKGGGQICSGLLIAADVVLTARHCICDGVKDHVVFGLSANGLDVDTYDVTGEKVMRPCPTVNGDSTMTPGVDVALLYLDKPSPNKTFRSVASRASIAGMKEIWAVGFGLTEKSVLGTKTKVNIPLASIDCSGKKGSQSDADYYKCVAGSELVAGMEGLKKDSCKGDSGGPVFLARPDGTLLLVAITSRPVGFAGAANCGDGGIYELTQNAVLDWLTKTNHISLKVI